MSFQEIEESFGIKRESFIKWKLLCEDLLGLLGWEFPTQLEDAHTCVCFQVVELRTKKESLNFPHDFICYFGHVTKWPLKVLFGRQECNFSIYNPYNLLDS